jgi:hypothetical protein
MSIKTKATTIKIVEVKNRGVLSEGRNSNMGFAMLKKVKKDSYETVNPISPCKDYLAEVVFTENTGIGTNGCGLKYPKKLNIYDKDRAYMVITIQQSMSGGYSYKIRGGYEADKTWLKANYKRLETLLNKFEVQLGFDVKTSVEEANDDYYLITLPLEWTKSTISISLYSLLLRVGQLYDNQEDIIDFLEKLPTSIDKSLINSALPRIKLILKEKRLPEQPENHITQASTKDAYFSPHGYGICSWDSTYPEIKVEKKAKKTKLKLTKV